LVPQLATKAVREMTEMTRLAADFIRAVGVDGCG
jgi:hypothetical protein